MKAFDSTKQHLPELQRELVCFGLEQAHPLVAKWRGDFLRADLEEGLKTVFALFDDDEEARRVAQAIGAPLAALDDHKPRLVEIEGHLFIAWIGSSGTPDSGTFIVVCHGSRPFGSIASRDVARRLAAEFSVFAPRYIRFFHPSHLDLKVPGTRIDMHFLAASVSEMAARCPTGLSRVSLAPPGDLSFYPDYVEAYERIYLVRPELRGAVCIESEDSLATAREHALLFDILVDGTRSGIVAARRETIAGLNAIYMVEIVLNESARGQGLGPAVHQRLASHVSATEPGAVLSGTIASVNSASLKTAFRAGRVEIGAWHWLEICR